jgi:3-epi-6-deoxocathasterone 23-monooxygenase
MNVGYLIPKDWCVMASLTSVHMDEKNYENPFKFDPWRWEVIQLLKLYLVMFILI